MDTGHGTPRSESVTSLGGQGTLENEVKTVKASHSDLEKRLDVVINDGAEMKEKDPYLVVFEPGDPENPKNWARWKRWYITMLGGVLVLNGTFASSSPSGVIFNLIDHFHISQEVAVLSISLFLCGYCVGPFVWAPLSEQYGRKPIFVISFICYTCFQLGCALSKNTASLLVFRFLAGTFAACPLTNSGSLIADIWDADVRGDALAIFTLAPFGGPSLGPIVGGYISTSGTSWRWLFYTMTIFAGVCTVLIVLTLPETYSPTILSKKAARIRASTGDNRYYTTFERQNENVPLSHTLEKVLARPFKIMIGEPMLIAVTIYMSFVYGCLYMLFEAYPIVFAEGHHMSSGASGLMFLPFLAGSMLAVLFYFLIFNPQYKRKLEAMKPLPVPPEERLYIAVYGAPIFAAGFFWFAWTSFPEISFWAPMMAGVVLGLSILWIFLALIAYIVDAYLFASASALASNTVVRSLVGAAFPLFSVQLYDALHPRWASSLFGFISLAMIPIPIILIKYGATLRAKSKYARS